MKSLILTLILLAQVSWRVDVVDNDYLVIHNNSNAPISCYVYYRDGDVTSVYVRAYSKSFAIWRHGLSGVECY